MRPITVPFKDEAHKLRVIQKLVNAGYVRYLNTYILNRDGLVKCVAIEDDRCYVTENLEEDYES